MMDMPEKTGIPFTGFPMEQPDMQIAVPEPNPYQTAAEETDFSRDTQVWD